MKWMSAVGLVLLLASAKARWIDAPITLAAVPFPIKWIVLSIFVAGLFGMIFKRKIVTGMCGLLGIGLCAFVIVHTACIDRTFWRLVDENEQYAWIIRFSRHHLPPNFGIQPTFRKDLPADTVLERLEASRYFMGLGWWVCAGGSGFMLAAWTVSKQTRRRKWLAVAVAVLVFSGPGLILARSFVGQYFYDKGGRLMGRGLYQEAGRNFQRALKWDRQLGGNKNIHIRMGEARFFMNDRNDPATQLYLGSRREEKKDFDHAASRYALARNAPHPLREIAERRLANIYIKKGFVLFKRDETGQAAAMWEKALDHDPSRHNARYFLARARFFLGQYQRSLSDNNIILAVSSNKILNSNIQSNIGDVYWKLGMFDDARKAYTLSMRLDSAANFRVIKSLGGT